MKPIALVPDVLRHRADMLDFKARKLACHAAGQKAPFTDFSDRVVCKPWGYEYLFYQGKSSAMWLLHLDPGQMTSMHCHLKKSTALFVLDGSINCNTLSRQITRLPGQGVWLGKKAFHQSKAGDTGATLLEVESPVDKHDLVRLNDAYGRERQGYEGPEKTLSMPKGMRTLGVPPAGAACTQRVGGILLSIVTPTHASAPLGADNVACVLEGAAIDAEGYRIVGPGDVLSSELEKNRVVRWIERSLVVVISKESHTAS